MSLVLKAAVRRLVKAPWFTLISLTMLALGIVMSTSAFSLTNAALLRPLPFPDPDRLVRIFTTSTRSPNWPLAPGNASDVRAALGTFGEFGFLSFEEQVLTIDAGHAELQSGLAVSANLLRVLGIQPLVGREFVVDEDQRGKPSVVLLTYLFWREHFGANPAVVGQTVQIDGAPFTIIGVLPPAFDEPLLWRGCKYVTPLAISGDWNAQRATRWVHIAGRLNPDVSLVHVQAQLDVVAMRLAQDYPREIGNTGLRVTALGPSFATPGVRSTYWLMVALSVAVFVITCANLGGVQLARTMARRTELSLRAALGATGRDILLAAAAEAALLAIGGTLLGLVLTYASRPALSAWLHTPLGPMDLRVIAFVVLAGLIAIAMFGGVPAYAVTRSPLGGGSMETSRGATAALSHQRLKRGLVVGQFALAVVLTTAASAFSVGIRSFLARERGWIPTGLVAGEVKLTGTMKEAERLSPTFAHRLQSALEELPGVESAAVASTSPLYGYQHPGPVVVEGVDTVAGHEPVAFITGVSRSYFATLRIPLIQGRLFAATWQSSDPAVAIVSLSTARRLFPSGGAVGRRVRFAPENRWYEIIGVVGDTSMAVGFESQVADLQVYRPVEEPYCRMYSFVLRTSLPVSALEHQIRRVVDAIDGSLTATQIAEVPTILEERAHQSPLSDLFLVYAVAGLAIALAGIYGLVSQVTQQRHREIGIRLALGANYTCILRMMLGEVGILLGVAMAAGVVGTLAMIKVLSTTLPGLPPLGMPMVLAITAALGVAGIIASFVPSNRAARMNPAEVLRSE